MEISVRYIPTDHVVRSNGDEIWSGNKPALCFIGERESSCIINDELMVDVRTLPSEIVVESREVQFNGMAYPPERFAERLRGIDKPISLEAARLLWDWKGEEALPPEKAEIAVAASSRGRPRLAAGKTLIAILAEELETPQPKLRRFLRAQGLRAPYEDEKQLRSILKTYPKEKTSGKVQESKQRKKRARP